MSRYRLEGELDLVDRSAQQVEELLERTPAELSADVAAHGLTLVGGSTLRPGFPELLARETGLSVRSRPRAADHRRSRCRHRTRVARRRAPLKPIRK